MNKSSNSLFLIVFCTLFFLSCTKNNDDFGPVTSQSNVSLPADESVIVLNEGNFMFGNGSITVIDENADVVSQQIFKQANGFPLGDVPQSMLIRDTLGYIIVNNSSKIEVVKLTDFSSVKTIVGMNSPRYMAVVNESPLTVWVTDLYAKKIWEINFESGKVTHEITTTGWDEYIYINERKAFILNTEDSVINIFDTDTRIKIGHFGKRVIDFKPWANSEYLILAKDGIYKYNTTSQQLLDVKLFDIQRSPSKMAVDLNNKKVYFLDKGVFEYDFATLKKVVGSSKGDNFYGLTVKQSTGEIYLTDAKDYVQPGVLKKYNAGFSDSVQYKVGINPQYILFK